MWRVLGLCLLASLPMAPQARASVDTGDRGIAAPFDADTLDPAETRLLQAALAASGDNAGVLDGRAGAGLTPPRWRTGPCARSANRPSRLTLPLRWRVFSTRSAPMAAGARSRSTTSASPSPCARPAGRACGKGRRHTPLDNRRKLFRPQPLPPGRRDGMARNGGASRRRRRGDIPRPRPARHPAAPSPTGGSSTRFDLIAEI